MAKNLFLLSFLKIVLSFLKVYTEEAEWLYQTLVLSLKRFVNKVTWCLCLPDPPDHKTPLSAQELKAKHHERALLRLEHLLLVTHYSVLSATFFSTSVSGDNL